jgi:hypothetical protein
VEVEDVEELHRSVMTERELEPASQRDRPPQVAADRRRAPERLARGAERLKKPAPQQVKA